MATLAPALCDETDEPVDDELSASVAHTHCTLEAQEITPIACQPSGGHHRGHVGTGSEISRSDSVEMRTYAETDVGSRCPSKSESTRGRVPVSS